MKVKKKFHLFFNKLKSCVFTKDIFQIVEDSDLFATKQLIQSNENLVHS
jgi:hypothetical protein